MLLETLSMQKFHVQIVDFAPCIFEFYSLLVLTSFTPYNFLSLENFFILPFPVYRASLHLHELVHCRWVEEVTQVWHI